MLHGSQGDADALCLEYRCRSPEFPNIRILLDVLCIFGQVATLTVCCLLKPVSPQQPNLTQCFLLKSMPEAVKYLAVRHLI